MSDQVDESGIRRAVPADAPILTALTERSGLVWGYPPDFFDWAPGANTMSGDDIRHSRVFLLEERGRILGFYSLSGQPPQLTMEKLFVEPDRIGTGCGRRLWQHAVETARQFGADALVLDADPHAAPFYRAMGAEYIGEKTTPKPDWTLHSFRYDLGT